MFFVVIVFIDRMLETNVFLGTQLTFLVHDIFFSGIDSRERITKVRKSCLLLNKIIFVDERG